MKFKFHTIINSLFISTFSTLPTLTFANSAINKDAIHDNKQVTKLGEITVKESIDSVPFQSNQTADQLRKNLVSNERDLFRNEVGIGVPEGGRSGSNGFAIRGVDQDRVAVIVDGIPQAESTMKTSARYSTERHNGNINNTEYENLGMVSVQKGANSVMDGSGSMGGTVSFRTKEIEDFVDIDRTFGSYLKTGYTSKNREWRQVLGTGFKTDGFFGFAQLTKRWGHETINNGKGDDIYGDKRGKPNPMSYHTTSWLSKVGYNLNNNHRVTAFFEDRQEKKFTEEKTLDLGDAYRFAKDQTPYRRYGLEYRYSGSSWLETAKILLAKQDIKQFSDLQEFSKNVPDKLDAVISLMYLQKQSIAQGEFSARPLNFAGIHHLSAKVEFRDKFLENKNRHLTFRNYQKDKFKKEGRDNYTEIVPVKSRVFSLSLIDDIEIGKSLKLIGGGRWDHYNYEPLHPQNNINRTQFDPVEKTLSHLSWQLGLEYQLHPLHQISYRLSTGFRVPRVEDLYFEERGGSGAQFLPNPDLKTETALNHELSYRFQNQYSQFSLGVFRTRYHNFIQEREMKCTQIPREWARTRGYCIQNSYTMFVNEPRATIRGIEFSGSLNGSSIGLSDGLTFHLKGSYSKGKNHDGDPLKSIQPWTVVTGIDYEAEKWSVSLIGRYSASKKAKDAEETEYGYEGKKAEKRQWPHLSPSYFVVDLTGQIKLSKDVTLNMGVFNLFNRDYITWDSAYNLYTRGYTSRTVGRNSPGINRFTAPKRNFAISIETRF